MRLRVSREHVPRPVLLDFGAARRVISDATQNLTAILKSGHSPLEQYEGELKARQGPWTDIYALCALLYTAAIGRPPLSSIGRVVRDDQVPARVAAKGRYLEDLLAAIDSGLACGPNTGRKAWLRCARRWMACARLAPNCRRCLSRPQRRPRPPSPSRQLRQPRGHGTAHAGR